MVSDCRSQLELSAGICAPEISDARFERQVRAPAWASRFDSQVWVADLQQIRSRSAATRMILVDSRPKSSGLVARTALLGSGCYWDWARVVVAVSGGLATSARLDHNRWRW